MVFEIQRPNRNGRNLAFTIWNPDFLVPIMNGSVFKWLGTYPFEIWSIFFKWSDLDPHRIIFQVRPKWISKLYFLGGRSLLVFMSPCTGQMNDGLLRDQINLEMLTL